MGARFVSWRLPQWFCETIGQTPCADPAQFEGLPVMLGKPGFVLALSVVQKLTGKMENSGHIASLLFSLAAGFMLYFWGKRFYDRFTGAAAAFILWFSNYHLFYARTGLHEIAAEFFFILSAFLLAHAATGGLKPSRVIVAGLFFGWTIGCSYRVLPFPLALVAVVIFKEVMSDRSWGGLKKNAAVIICFGVGFILSLLILDAFYYILFSPHYVKFASPHYLPLFFQKMDREAGFNFQHPFFYLNILYRFNGPVFMTALAGGMLILIKKIKNTSSLIILTSILAPLAFFSILSTRLARTITIISPFAALACAVFASSLLKMKIKKPWPVILSLAILISIPLASAGRMIQILNLESGYRQCAEFLKKENQTRVMTTMKPIMALYMGSGNAIYPPPELKQVLKLADAENIRYLMMDWQKYVWDHKSTRLIDANALPVKVIQNPYVDFFSILYENHLPDDVEYLKKRDPYLNLIKIYDLENLKSAGL